MTVELWHCGVRPVTFDGRAWVVSASSIDATTAPLTFEGDGTMRLVEPDVAVYADHGSATEIRFTPLVGEYDPPPCL